MDNLNQKNKQVKPSPKSPLPQQKVNVSSLQASPCLPALSGIQGNNSLQEVLGMLLTKGGVIPGGRTV
jgi:hypothetical protein